MENARLIELKKSFMDTMVELVKRQVECQIFGRAEPAGLQDAITKYSDEMTNAIDEVCGNGSSIFLEWFYEAYNRVRLGDIIRDAVNRRISGS